MNTELANNPNFATIKNLLDTNKNDNTFKYIQAFDNYIKHIKTVLVTVKNSFFLGNNNEFEIREFINDGVVYPSKDAITTVRGANQYISDFIETVLTEVKTQLPNCVDNSHRIHNISFKLLVKELETGVQVNYISFFIDVQNDLIHSYFSLPHYSQFFHYLR